MAGALIGAGAKTGAKYIAKPAINFLGRVLFGGPVRATTTAVTADQMLNDGRGIKAAFNFAAEKTGNAVLGMLLPGKRNFDKFMEDLGNGNITESLKNPILIGAVAALTFATQLFSGNNIMNAALMTMVVGGIAYMAQKYALKETFGTHANPESAPEAKPVVTLDNPLQIGEPSATPA